VILIKTAIFRNKWDLSKVRVWARNVPVIPILAIFALLSVLIALWQWFAAIRFPLNRREANLSFAPSVTVLKPLKGLDDNTINCLHSWLTQKYPGNVEVLFGVHSPDDPVCGPLRRLLKENPHCNAGMVYCRESLGVNAKVSTLIQLSRQAQHEIIVVSDADVFVPPDFLANVVAPLREAKVGLVNCFYRLANPTTTAMRWEALATNADFWSQVLQGRTMQPLDFALGAVMATRREELAEIGGFEALADYLADDFQLGNRVVRIAGKEIALCPVVVDCLSAPMGWREAWSHQLRWARTIRACKPLPYAFSILGNPTVWPLLWTMFQPGRWSFITLAASLLIRAVSAHDLQRRLGAVAGQGAYWWLAPVKDVLQLALWASALFGNRIIWRGQHYRLQRSGLLVREEANGEAGQSAMPLEPGAFVTDGAGAEFDT
jgi:ceramide glucosyltransferase